MRPGDSLTTGSTRQCRAETCRFATALASATFPELMAICATESVLFESLFNLVRYSNSEDFVDWATAGIESGTYESGNSTMVTNSSWARQLVRVSQDADVDTSIWARQLVRVSQDADVDTSILEALLSCLMRTIELGHGADDMQPCTRPSDREAATPD